MIVPISMETLLWIQGAFLVVSDTLGVEWGFPDWVTNTIKGRIENKVDLCLCF